MGKKLFVGSLEWGVTDEDLQQHFAQYGNVEDAIVIKDKLSGRSKGFGFVSYSSDEEAETGLNLNKIKVTRKGGTGEYEPYHKIMLQAGKNAQWYGGWSVVTPPYEYSWRKKWHV